MRLIIHERVRALFQRSLDFARHTGYFQSRRLKVVLDTTYILLGRGALKDTYNLLADGINVLARGLAAEAPRSNPEEWARERGLGRYFGSSLKAEVGIDWDDPERRRLHEAAVLLEQLLLQDIERREDGTRLKQGVSPDRVVSVHDP